VKDRELLVAVGNRFCVQPVKEIPVKDTSAVPGATGFVVTELVMSEDVQLIPVVPPVVL